MVDHPVLTSLHQLLFILKILFTFFTIQATIFRSSDVLSLPPQLVFLGCALVTRKKVLHSSEQRSNK
jgi:hypothetical protein